jgi:hypothetical protein
MRYKFTYKQGWRGTLFMWNEFFFNSGRPYTMYRLGPLALRLL